MNSVDFIEDDERKRLRLAAILAAQEKAVSVDTSEPLMLFWNQEGVCRAFNLTTDNLHWSVPSLYGIYFNVSFLPDNQ